MGEVGDTTTSCTGKHPLAREHGIRVTQAGRDLGGLLQPSQSKQGNQPDDKSSAGNRALENAISLLRV